MDRQVARIGLLLFFSGFCALDYQVVWLREMRLIFGASTAANAAVLAIFMGGLGLGGAVLGRRADLSPNPLRLYGHLELAIAAAALLTPIWLIVVRQAYIWSGGAAVLGGPAATLVRILLAALVLGPPTFLMGGTLPAAVKAAETENDAGRRRLGFIYGLNTLGAVTGAALATFFLLEIYGARQTLIMAGLLNVVVGFTARAMSRSMEPLPGPIRSESFSTPDRPNPENTWSGKKSAPPLFVFLAAGLVGLAFFLMELVWYRMLGPLLGGSTYTFGLILAVALLGIGLGAVLFTFREAGRQAELSGFALTCGLEALCLAIPYALGDRLAVLAALLNSLGQAGLTTQVLGWSLITLMVVGPAAALAGYQFPLLVGLLGRGGQDVGRQTGLTYMANTLGAIAGSLAGGFGLLPLLSAPGAWKAAVLLLAFLAVAAAVLSWSRREHPLGAVLPLTAAVLTLALLWSGGPTAAWRHSPIGAGRVDTSRWDRLEINNWLRETRRSVVWETDGLESTVGLSAANGLTFIINGKADGNAWADAPTQVMLGLLGAAFHPRPQKALVIGLGTGCSAGWLADVPGIERVDVVELEPGVLEVARQCAPVNRNVLANPKVNTIIADAREVLLTSDEKYDLIASEPSNPYRAGIASLYTREFYRAAARRLSEDGLFIQWVQAYEVDTETILTIYRTLASVFPVVETWQSHPRDMLLVCSRREKPWPVSTLRRKLSQEPFRSALTWAWGATDLESFAARFIARSSLGRTLAEGRENEFRLNTDDLMLVEFGFARTVGRRKAFTLLGVRQTAKTRNEHRPTLTEGDLDWDLTEDAAQLNDLSGPAAPGSPEYNPARRRRLDAFHYFVNWQPKALIESWSAQPRPPVYPLEKAMLAEALAEQGDEEARSWSQKLKADWPLEAAIILGRLEWRLNRTEAGLEALTAAFLRLRREPCALTPITERGLKLVQEIAEARPDLAPRCLDMLKQPFCVNILEEARKFTQLGIARRLDPPIRVQALKAFEPNVPWRESFLRERFEVYQAAKDPLAVAAERDLAVYYLDAPTPFSINLFGGKADEATNNRTIPVQKK
ncbi:MAG: fused MFS/spermidine synthase [Thermodesulfobacteriota bacterium]